MTRMSDHRDRSPSGSVCDADSLVTDEARGLRDDHQAIAGDNGKVEQQPQIPFDTLRRTPHIVFLTLGYAVIALFAWIIMCILMHKPIGAPSYTFHYHSSDNILDKVRPAQIPYIFSKSERFLRAARAMQSVVSVLTIPLTSLVCSYATVAFLQRQPKQGRQGPTLRQSIALADKGWTDPVLLAKLVAGGWKRYGSIFLLVAILLNLLGASITPLQSILLSYRTIKVPSTGANAPDNLLDLASLINHFEEFGELDNGYTTVDLRSRLESVQNTAPQFRLWSRQPGCGHLPGIESDPTCETAGQYTFGSMNRIRDPFWSPLPNDFNTGIFQQFAPRVNFTSKFESITTDAFPQDCDQIPGALFLHYENMTNYGGYAVDVCMPGNVAQSPWKAQLSRQDFSEELYLNISLANLKGMMTGYSFVPGAYVFKVTLNTTAGYFELPNYMNGRLPGPLLDDGPIPHCGHQCIPQGFPVYPNDKASSSTNSIHTNAIKGLAYPMNRGPLLSTALALFGAGSYLDIRHTVAQAYEDDSKDEWGGCIGIVPFVSLLNQPGVLLFNMVNPCVRGDDAKLQQIVIPASYLWLFAANARNRFPLPELVQDAFAASAFLAVDVWSGQTLAPMVDLFWAPGDDLQIPHMSWEGITLISFLLGLDLVCLLVLALYSTWTPRWTNQLDSFAMIRISASIHDRLPFQLANDPDKIKSLDALPGWIGEESGTEGSEVDRVGELALGGEMPLKGGRKYHCYAVDDTGESPANGRRRHEYSKAPGERE